MTTQPQPRFQRGDQVLYMGSKLRLQGNLFRIESRTEPTPGNYRYLLVDEAWGRRLDQVRETSLRGPDD